MNLAISRMKFQVINIIVEVAFGVEIGTMFDQGSSSELPKRSHDRVWSETKGA
jgi:hypothetical protein